MVKRSKRSLSKRQTLRRKFSILKKVREHKRDMRSAAKRMKKEGHKRSDDFKSERAVLNVPMKNSEKEDLLRAAIAARKEAKELKKEKKLKRKNEDPDAAARRQAAAQAEARRQAAIRAKKEAENMDFALQLEKCLGMSNLMIIAVDARCPSASLSDNLVAAAAIHKVPLMVLLTKHDLVPSEVVQAWVQHLQANTKAKFVIPYNATTFVATLQKEYGMGNKVYATIVGLPNVGVRTVCKDLEEVQGGRVSVHPSKEAARGRVPYSKEICVMTLPTEPTITQLPLFGPDTVFRPWQNLVNNLKDVELHAEEVLRHFEARAVCLNYRMGLPAKEPTPAELLALIGKRRSLQDIREAARIVLVDFNQGTLKWCCVPPTMAAIREGWTVLDESFLATQDYAVLTGEAPTKSKKK
eukprot:PhM_4_TR13814/c0_g1_i1/m.18950/K14538/NUG1, GNL3; nuclear GTP-binding protein